jgi:hypothetical protein
MVEVITAEIRALSRRCSALARECSDRKLSNALDVLAFDFACTASEFGRRFGRNTRTEGAVKPNSSAGD